MEFLGLFLRHHFTGKVVVASLVSLLWTVIAMQPCNNIPCYNKANYTSPLIDESVKKDSSLVYVLKFFRKCWNFFAKSWLFFSGYHVLGICFSGFSAVIIRIINLSVMWLCNVIVKMGKNATSVIKAFLHVIFVFVFFCLFLKASIKHHHYLCFLIHEFHWAKILKLLHHEVVWVGVASL